tara:strand:+ start:149 stop:367 length:219 start_codon:yes stop_codon:yes gene_type:complete
MNSLSIFLYLTFFIAVASATFAFMWQSTYQLYKELNKPIKKYKVPAPHPEMEGVKYGEELLVFKAKEEDNIE